MTRSNARFPTCPVLKLPGAHDKGCGIICAKFKCVENFIVRYINHRFRVKILRHKAIYLEARVYSRKEGGCPTTL